MKHFKSVLALALLGCVAMPASGVADDRHDPARQFFRQIIDRDGARMSTKQREERLAGRYFRDDDDDDDGRRGGGRDDDDDDDDDD